MMNKMLVIYEKIKRKLKEKGFLDEDTLDFIEVVEVAILVYLLTQF